MFNRNTKEYSQSQEKGEVIEADYLGHTYQLVLHSKIKFRETWRGGHHSGRIF